MKKIKVAIVGYGNLGKSLEELLLNDKRFDLKCVFSRRDIKAKVFTYPMSKIKNFKNKIDLLFLCGGSKSDIENQAEELVNDFNFIDCFDNHNHIKNYISNLEEKAKCTKHTCVCCCGWDPGLFSMMRLLFNSIEGNCFTFWGKGVSQGHSQAIRNIKGVEDAIQYTLPNKEIVKQIKNGVKPNVNTKDLHHRQCFVVANGNKNLIKETIIKMPDYFEGYKTTVKFIDGEQMKSHKKLYHGGEVLTLNDTMNFKLKLESNPVFTAKVMKAYAIALNNLYESGEYGAYSILDIAPKYLTNSDYIAYI